MINNIDIDRLIVHNKVYIHNNLLDQSIYHKVVEFSSLIEDSSVINVYSYILLVIEQLTINYKLVHNITIIDLLENISSIYTNKLYRTELLPTDITEFSNISTLLIRIIKERGLHINIIIDYTTESTNSQILKTLQSIFIEIFSKKEIIYPYPILTLKINSDFNITNIINAAVDKINFATSIENSITKLVSINLVNLSYRANYCYKEFLHLLEKLILEVIAITNESTIGLIGLWNLCGLDIFSIISLIQKYNLNIHISTDTIALDYVTRKDNILFKKKISQYNSQVLNFNQQVTIYEKIFTEGQYTQYTNHFVCFRLKELPPANIISIIINLCSQSRISHYGIIYSRKYLTI